MWLSRAKPGNPASTPYKKDLRFLVCHPKDWQSVKNEKCVWNSVIIKGICQLAPGSNVPCLLLAKPNYIEVTYISHWSQIGWLFIKSIGEFQTKLYLARCAKALWGCYALPHPGALEMHWIQCVAKHKYYLKKVPCCVCWHVCSWITAGPAYT